MILKAFAILVGILALLFWAGALFAGDNRDAKALAIAGCGMAAIIVSLIDLVLWAAVLL